MTKVGMNVEQPSKLGHRRASISALQAARGAIVAAQGGANVYRTPELPESAGGLVTIRRYLDPLNAQMDRAHLEGGGIRAHVIEGVSFNPLLSGVGGGVQLQVGERDVEQAEAILDAAAPADVAGDDGEAPGAVRCPR